jgi:mannose-6-phosphate isomerase
MLDAQDRLSVQVHPPAAVAEQLGGEPKTEMWYVLDALLESDLYAGLKRGVTRETFEQALAEGRVADQIHHLRVKKGDAMFIPSGRIHAIGAGNIIVEVQQNSDTTYRVFDWNRLCVDGRLRELHVEASLASINFDDPEPAMAQADGEGVLVRSEFFHVEKWKLDAPRIADNGERFAIFAVVEGGITCGDHAFGMGSFFLVPPVMAYDELKPEGDSAAVLRITMPGT